MIVYASKYSYTVDKKHGLGILFDGSRENFNKCFYEDGKLISGKSIESYYPAIDELDSSRKRADFYLPKKSHAERDKLIKTATCEISPGDNQSLHIELKDGSETFQIDVAKKERSYYEATCSCGKFRCIHIPAADQLVKQRIEELKHQYVVSDLPVDKKAFLEGRLKDAIRSLEVDELDLATVEKIKEIIKMVDEAHSDDYYWLLHEYLLDMSVSKEYDSHFLEELYSELLLALFEDPGYRKAVLDMGSYAESSSSDGRQHKSNKACFKRVLKGYNKAIKEMNGKGDFKEDYCKEFILKYRQDLPGLFRYLAEGVEELYESDYLYLKKIADLPDLNLDYIGSIAMKLDVMADREKAADVLRCLAKKLTMEQRVEIYSKLQHLFLSTQEIRMLGREEQLKMIHNAPLTVENFCYIMDDLLSDSNLAEKGKYILNVLERCRLSNDDALKKAIIEKTAGLPHNRLLMSFVLRRLDSKEKNTAHTLDPEKDLNTYFSCDYKIIRSNQSMHSEFSVSDPETKLILLDVVEENGKLANKHALFSKMGYSLETIKKVCLEGKEKAYKEALEANKDALAATLFEQKNKKFAQGYKALCTSFSDGKILFAEEGKVGIDWLIYRANGSNALAFRVGRNRKYVVKDAAEFVDAFRNGTTLEYGKDLVLTHDLENLNETDAAIIQLLTTAKYSRGGRGDSGNKRYITISDTLLANMLEALAGQTVNFNDLPCLLRMEPRNIKLKINGEYVLSTDIDKSKQVFFNLLGKGYLLSNLSNGEQALDRVEGSVEGINLVGLVDENPSVSIKPILKDFRKNIYSRLFEMFEVDPAIKNDFVLSQLRLNTYFDFEKNIITSRTVLLWDGNELKPDQLTDRIDRVKIELLESYLQSLGFVDGTLSEESRVLAFFKMDFTRLKTMTNVYLSDQLKNKEIKSIGRPVIRVTYENNLVNVFLEKSEFTEEELAQIVAGLKKKRKYILLGKDRIIDLDSEAARDFGETVNDFAMDPKDLYQKKVISMVNAIKAFSHERSCRVDKYLRDMIEEIRSFKESEIPLPKLNAELRDYQVEGYRWLSILSKYHMGGILADDMGLGKTIQMIALLKSDKTKKPSIVICPKSLVFNWASEFARFDGTTKVTTIYGPDTRRSALISEINEKEKAVYVTSFDSLRNDISKYACEFNYVILDEAQYIKNVNALKTKSVKELKADHRFALTGTPIENSVVDLWSIFDFIMPGYFEELSRFRDTETALIARKAAPFILRRVKEDVLEDLPAKYERILTAEMNTKQRKIYDAMRQEAKKALQAGGKAFDLLPYLTRLRQVCVDPGMFIEDYQGGSGKIDMLATLIPEYLQDNHRILIFSQFVKALEQVQKMLEKKGIPTYFLSGATSAKDRLDMMDSFNNGSGTDVFLISLKAGGTGLNLTGADTVIHLDPWWNVAAENQASDRTHRIGQTRNVEVIKLIADESIEQRVMELQDIKKEVIKQVISDDDGSVTSASLEDIAFVLD